MKKFSLLLFLCLTACLLPAQQVRLVGNTNPNGPGSLVQAIDDAFGGDTIRFDNAIWGGTITLGLNNKLVLDKDLVIEGPQTAPVSVHGGGSQLFEVVAPATVAMHHLILRFGGDFQDLSLIPIFNGGTLRLENCEISDNQIDGGAAGAIRNEGTLILNDCLFANNSAGFTGGAGHISSDGDLFVANTTFTNGNGGGIGGIFATGGEVVMANCVMGGHASRSGPSLSIFGHQRAWLKGIRIQNGDNSRGGAGGLGMSGSAGGDSLIECSFSDNSGYGRGGVAISGNHEVVMVGTLIEENYASLPQDFPGERAFGGGLYNSGRLKLIDCEIRSNFSEGGYFCFDPTSCFYRGLGGGIYNQGRLTLINTVIEDNGVAGLGAGIYNADSLYMTGCRLQDNEAVGTARGGGLYTGPDDGFNSPLPFTRVEATNFIGNVADIGSGGGLFAETGKVELLNCLFYHNEANRDSLGGAVYAADSQQVRMLHCTLSENAAGRGGGIFAQKPRGIQIYASILVGNEAQTQGNDLMAAGNPTNYDGSVQTLGYNLIGDFYPYTQIGPNVRWFPLEWPGGAATDQMNVDEDNLFRPLSDYGGPGPLQSLPPVRGSLASDSGDPNDTLRFDARGYPRVGLPDIGAYEQQLAFVAGDSLAFCVLSDTVRLNQPIVIEDTTGGAFLPGEDQTFILLAPKGINFKSDVGTVQVQGPGIRLKDSSISSQVVFFVYDRGREPGPIRVTIDGLEVFAPLPDSTENLDTTLYLRRPYGTARIEGVETTAARPFATFTLGKGSRPEVDFSFQNVCEGDLTNFSPAVFNEVGDLDYWVWDFGDGDSSNSPFFATHQFGQVADFEVSLTVGPDSLCTTTHTRTVSTLRSINLPQDQAYFNDFEDIDRSTQEWAITGTINDNPGSSWKLGSPAQSVLSGAASGQLAFVTGDSSNYANFEQSFVNSPCLVLDQLARPMVTLDIAYDIEPNFDGVALQYSLDGGQRWDNLGAPDRDSEPAVISGINWYDFKNLVTQPGGNNDLGGFGWSGRANGTWRNARFRLDTLGLGGGSSVRFRMALASDEVENYEGFAFDNVFIGERSELILVEEFTPSRLDSLETLLPLALFNDLVVVHFPTHTGRYDLDARAFSYGISAFNPAWVADGRALDLASAEEARFQLERASLKARRFEIRMDTARAEVTVVPQGDYAGEVLVHLLVVEQSLDPATPYRYDAVNMLPSPGGTAFVDLRDGDPYRVSADQASALVPIPAGTSLDPARAYTLAMVQDPRTRAILQMERLPAGPATRSNRESGPAPLPQPFTVYPNPARTETWLRLDHLPAEPYAWTLIDLQGRPVLRGWTKTGQFSTRLDVSSLASGMYQLQVRSPEGESWQQKVGVVR